MKTKKKTTKKNRNVAVREACSIDLLSGDTELAKIRVFVHVESNKKKIATGYADIMADQLRQHAQHLCESFNKYNREKP